MRHKTCKSLMAVLCLALAACADVDGGPAEDRDYTDHRSGGVVADGVDQVDDLADLGIEKGVVEVGCSDNERRQARVARDRLLEVMKHVLRNFESGNNATFREHFGSASQSKVEADFRELKSYFRNSDLKIRCVDCDDRLGSAPQGEKSGYITLCNGFFNPSRVSRRPSVLVHEAAHMVFDINHGDPPGHKGVDNAYSFGNYFEQATEEVYPSLSE